MNRQQIDLVRASFALVQPIATQAAAIFYDKLFAADPSLSQRPTIAVGGPIAVVATVLLIGYLYFRTLGAARRM